MDLKPILSKYFPENSIGPGTGKLQGQCAVFAEAIVDIPKVGDTYASKKNTVLHNGILAANVIEYRIGDVLICSDGTFMGFGAGHVAVVANLNSQWLYLAESNYNKKLRVDYGRKIARGDKRIYGLLRGNFLVDLQLPPVLTLTVSVLMQYEKEWDSSIFQKVIDRMTLMSGGKIKLEFFPLYTYNSLKNWWYSIYPFNNGEYKVVAPQYINESVIPLADSNNNKPANLIIWAINNQQWQGGFTGGDGTYKEYGWNYYGALPPMATIACDEADMSFKYPEDSAFLDYLLHEMTHMLSHWGRIDNYDNTDVYYFQGDRSKAFTEFDYEHMAVNLL